MKTKHVEMRTIITPLEQKPHEAKASFDGLKKGAIGVGIAVSGTWIASKVLGYF